MVAQVLGEKKEGVYGPSPCAGCPAFCLFSLANQTGRTLPGSGKRRNNARETPPEALAPGCSGGVPLVPGAFELLLPVKELVKSAGPEQETLHVSYSQQVLGNSSCRVLFIYLAYVCVAWRPSVYAKLRSWRSLMMSPHR